MPEMISGNKVEFLKELKVRLAFIHIQLKFIKNGIRVVERRNIDAEWMEESNNRLVFIHNDLEFIKGELVKEVFDDEFILELLECDMDELRFFKIEVESIKIDLNDDEFVESL